MRILAALSLGLLFFGCGGGPSVSFSPSGRTIDQIEEDVWNDRSGGSVKELAFDICDCVSQIDFAKLEDENAEAEANAPKSLEEIVARIGHIKDPKIEIMNWTSCNQLIYRAFNPPDGAPEGYETSTAAREDALKIARNSCPRLMKLQEQYMKDGTNSYLIKKEL